MAKKYKWMLNKLQYPPSGHLVVTDANYQHSKEFAVDLSNSIDELRRTPELNNKGEAAMYGMAAKLPSKSLVGEALVLFMETVLDV